MDPTQLPLAVPTSILDRSMDVCLPVSIEPLFPKCRQKRREQCATKSRVKCCLDLTDAGIWAGPAWGRYWLAGRCVSDSGIE